MLGVKRRRVCFSLEGLMTGYDDVSVSKSRRAQMCEMSSTQECARSSRVWTQPAPLDTYNCFEAQLTVTSSS